jgi:predicted dinucleotide-binding enzyme
MIILQTKLAESKLEELTVEPSAEALKTSDVIILATPAVADDAGIQEFAKSLGDMSGKIIIDATNPLGPFPEGLNIRWDKTTSGGEVLAAALPTAKVYKAFNTVGVEHMKAALGKDMMFAGDPDEATRAVVEDVVKGVGFKPFYVGPIRYARNLEAIAELWIHMAVPPLGGRTTSRNFWFSISGDP